MGYYLRAFCTSDDIPPLRAVLSWADEHGIRLDAPSAEVDTLGWEQAEVAYRPDKQPLIVEKNLGELVNEEVDEFLELLDDVDDSAEKQMVIAHLAQCKAIVAVQLLGDHNGDAFDAAGILLTFFVGRCGGLVQADGEGFYKGDRLIVSLG